MRHWLHGKRGGVLAFLAIAALVAGGLGWATAAALRLEREQLDDRARMEQGDQLRLAMSLLENRVTPALSKEDHRPYDHYSAVYATAQALTNKRSAWSPETVLQTSPLLSAELPDWVLLHFWVAEDTSDGKALQCGSPQVLSDSLLRRLGQTGCDFDLSNVTPERERLFAALRDRGSAQALLARVEERTAQLVSEDFTLVPINAAWNVNEGTGNTLKQPQQKVEAPRQDVANNNDAQAPAQPPEPQAGGQAGFPQNPGRGKAGNYDSRSEQMRNVQQELRLSPTVAELNLALNNTVRNGENWFSAPALTLRPSEPVAIGRGPMVRLWLTTADGAERLVAARLVRIGKRQLCQGLLLDWPRLQEVLAEAVADPFPEAQFVPMREEVPPHPERTMIALPVEMDPGPVTPAEAPGWTPLRVGLCLAWAAALVALGAVGLGGWSLVDLSERRIRFVSAVTHELRTPLTTLRLYLDMLTGGLVRDERQKDEYLQTLNSEADRLSRLVGNVLDFSRLESQRPKLAADVVEVRQLLDQARATWEARCQDAGKELVVEERVPGDTALVTDLKLAQQVLGNLIDNACKYSRDAEDPRIWLRARSDRPGRLLLEVEDRGPGVPASEGRAIFRAFRRGRGSDVTAGGVGLGLALAERWARLLGGRLRLKCDVDRAGACFQFELPMSNAPA